MTTAAKTERERLSKVANTSLYAETVNATMIRYTAQLFERFWKGTRCLELGPAEGLLSDALAAAFPNFTAVEGAPEFCEVLRQRLPGARIVNALFEEFDTVERFDTIVLGHVLEHVDDPRAILRSVSRFLAPGGVICCAVPNARSLHRQAAVMMGMLEAEYSLSELDVHHGHRRIYNPESFRADFSSAGLRVKHFGGYWLKPVSNRQLADSWTPAMLDSFMQLGERYPDIAAEIYVIAEKAAD